MGDLEGILAAEKQMLGNLEQNASPIGQSQAQQAQLLAAAAYARHGCLSEHASLIQKAYVVPFSAFQAGSYRAPRRI